MSEKRFAILIASSHFPEDSRLQTLRCPTNDVDGLKEVLESSQDGGFTDIIVLKNKRHNEVNFSLADVFERAGKEDLVFVYYSGHGKQDYEGQLYLTTVDTRINKLTVTSVAIETIKKLIKFSQTAKVVIVLDCCYSGAVSSAFLRGGVDDELRRMSETRGTYILTASTATQAAAEKEGDRYGLLTKHIISGIKSGEAADDDGFVRMSNLYRYVSDKVRRESAQEPMMWELNINGSELIIARARRPRKELSSAPPLSRGESEYVGIGGKFLHYWILERISNSVYKAVDKKLGRTVAVKALSPELTTQEVHLQRFMREARLASALDHPNICVIHDFHELNGWLLIIMQYLEGKNVRRLVNGRPLRLESALTIAIQVTDALASTHARGIVHRNIKAENVIVSSMGRAKIIGFGMAKLRDDELTLTELGVPFGTATYAAPEQARGDRADHRSDIFSTGVLLYEMLTGTWPFHGKDTIDVRYAVLYENPKPVASRRPDVIPERLQRALERALAKEPGDRYQKISEMRDDLRAIYHEGVSVNDFVDLTELESEVSSWHVLGSNRLARAVRWLRTATGTEATASPTYTSRTEVPNAEQKSVAVLPFKNLAEDPNLAFYEFALADAVITELARVQHVVVRPSSLMTKYQGREVDPREIGHDLNVATVLEAGFLIANDTFRVSARLIDVNSRDVLWSDRFNVNESSDIISIQDIIARDIVQGISFELSHAEDNVSALETNG